MYSLLLAIIYFAFISMGLPDSLLGSAWPVMHTELGVPLSYAGIISMIITGGTVISSLFSERLTKKAGTGMVTAVSVAMTAAALVGFSLASSFAFLCLWAVPYGLGAGAIDASLNNYVALHYSSKHMSWLHASWGVGVTVSPYIMSHCLSNQLGWNTGYRLVSFVQIALAAMLFLSLPFWNKKEHVSEEMIPRSLTLKEKLHIPGVPYILLTFFGFSAFEATAGLWASSYLASFRNVEAEIAAGFTALFYLGETLGRFLNGFVADYFGDRKMIQVGIWTMLAGIVMIFLPLKILFLPLAGLFVIGLGAAPVYPCIIHSTPDNFGKENSLALVGFQIACAYCGSTFMPPLFGLLSESVSLGLYPLFLGIFALLMLVMSGLLNRTVARSRENN